MIISIFDFLIVMLVFSLLATEEDCATEQLSGQGVK